MSSCLTVVLATKDVQRYLAKWKQQKLNVSGKNMSVEGKEWKAKLYAKIKGCTNQEKLIVKQRIHKVCVVQKISHATYQPFIAYTFHIYDVVWHQTE